MAIEGHSALQNRKPAVWLVSLLAIAAVGLLASQWVLAGLGDRATAAYVNISGRQRMLSQRIAWLSQRLREEADHSLPANRSELDALVDRLETAHMGLRDGSPRLGLDRPRSERVSRVLFEDPHRLDEQVAEYVALVRELLATTDSAAIEKLANQIKQTALHTHLLGSLDAFVMALQLDGEERATRSQRLICSLLLVVLALAVALAVVARPSATKESEKLYRTIADCARVGMWVCNEKGECTWLNRQWLEFAGRDLASQIGSGWLETVHPGDRESAAQVYLAAFERRETFTLDYRLRRADGEYRWHTAIGTPRVSQNNEFLGYLGLSLEDHDARIARVEVEQLSSSLRDSSAIHRSLVDQSSNFIGLMELDGTLIDANRTALRAAGIEESEVLGKPFWETPWWIHSRDLQARLKQAVKSAALGEADQFEATHVAENGELIYVNFSLTPVKDGEGNTIYLIPEGQDVTLHKRREQELSSLLEELDKSNEELEQFAYVASHDLQEPLRKITSYGELLREEQGDRLNEEGLLYLGVVMDSAKRLQILVQDLLAFSRITTRGNPLAPTSADGCLRAALSDLEVAISESSAQITIDPLPTVLADDSQLARLFQNLVGNAIKYRGEAAPRIHVGGERRDGAFEFFVRDNGIGIDQEYFERIFRIFQRLHNRRDYSGTGIGLALCKRIVERFGGEIWVESSPGAGSAFYFTIPLAPEDTSRKESSDVQSPSETAAPSQLVGVGAAH